MADSSKDLVVSKSQATNVWGGIFTLLVGIEKKPLLVHETVLGSSSAFFQKAMRAEWTEARPDPKTIDMSHCSTELFSAYVHWLYFKTIPMDKVDLSDAESLKSYASMAGAYVLGEELMDIKFKNAVMDIFLAHVSTTIPDPMMIKIIYNGTPKSSPGRRLMADVYAYRVEEGKTWDAAFENCSGQFLIDVLKAMTKARRPPLFTPSPWTIFAGAAYHEIEPK